MGVVDLLTGLLLSPQVGKPCTGRGQCVTNAECSAGMCECTENYYR